MSSLSRRPTSRFAISLVSLTVLMIAGCGDDNGGTKPPVGGRTLSVPLDNEFGPLTLVQALGMAVAGDSILVQSGYAETFAATVVVQSTKTPLYLAGTKQRPVITAPGGGTPALRFIAPKAGTRVELIEFHGGNASVQVEGGAVGILSCMFQGGGVHVRGTGAASLDIRECILDRPGTFGIEANGGTVTAVQNTVYHAGDCGLYISSGARLIADKNIITESTNWGIACRLDGNLASGSMCNDVFGSGVDPYSDCDGAATDFSLDPLLCDPGQKDFRVDVRSPCAPQNVAGSECEGTGNPDLGVGALGVGCSPGDE